MSYKSISAHIESLGFAERLVIQTPVVPGRQDRVFCVEKELHEQIVAGSQATNAGGFRVGMLVNDIDKFIQGGLITVGCGKEKTCFLKQLDPRRDEVWELRSRDPKPAIRMFGRFAMPDVFVATNLAWRASLEANGGKEWDREIRRCKAIWRHIFPSQDPHSGKNINDYISTNVVEIGKLA